MRKTSFKHENVRPDGTFTDKPGAVKTTGGMVQSEDKGGCNLKGCNCSRGHWISIILPRTPGGTVEGFTINFDTLKEKKDYLSKLQ